MHISKCNDTMRFDVAVSFHPTSLFLSLIYYLPGKIAPLCEGIKSLRASINDLYVKEHRLAKISQASIYALPFCLSAIIDDLNLNFMLWYVRTFHLFSTPRFSHLKVHTRLLLSATGFLFEYPISLFLSVHLYSFSVLMHLCILSNERTNEIHLRFWPFLLLGHIIHTASKSFLFRTLTNILQHTTISGNRLTFYYALQYAAAPKETITENRFPNVFIHFLLPMLLLLLFSRFLSVLSAMNIHTLDFSFWYSIVVLRCVWVCECVCVVWW